MEEFADLRQRLVGEVIGQECQQRIADERQIGQKLWVATARAVFSHKGVTPPVVADFGATPVSADEPEPLGWPVFIGQGAGKIVAGFGGAQTGLFNGALAAQNDQASCKREVSPQRFDGEGVQAAHFDSTVTGLGVGKKGVRCRASQPLACWSRRGWLALIWTR